MFKLDVRFSADTLCSIKSLTIKDWDQLYTPLIIYKVGQC